MQPIPPHTDLGELTITSVLVEVDEPRLFIARNGAGELFLAVFSAGDYAQETWVYAPITPQQAREVQEGCVDYHTAFRTPLGGVAWQVSYAPADAKATSIKCSIVDIPDTWLPKPGRKTVPSFFVVDRDVDPGAHLLPRTTGKSSEAA